MPGKNLEKIYVADHYYHVYNRGINKEHVFHDKEDYSVFLNLFKRYLSNEPVKDNKGREYPWLHEDIELLAFCLMPNHFHALVYPKKPEALTALLKNISTAYGMYYNKKYKRLGPIFQARFRATIISDDSYHQHITRYIHLNPERFKHWQYSSLPYYLGTQSAEWLNTRLIDELFDGNQKEYLEFLEDYKDYKESIDSLKTLLADQL